MSTIKVGSENDPFIAKEKKLNGVRMALPAAVLVASFYYSISFTTGIAIGYLLSRLFFKFFVNKGRVDHLLVDFGKWKFHLHHWMTGVIVLAIAFMIDRYLPTFFIGTVCGIIIHDIYDFNDWYKVIHKNPVEEKI